MPTWLHTLGCLVLGEYHTIVIIWVMKTFLRSSSVCSCHLFLISSASVRPIPLVIYCVHLCMKYSLGISNFLEEISSLSHSVVFLYSFEIFHLKRLFILLAVLWNSILRVYLSFSPLPFISLLFTAICKASSDSHFAFLHFFSWGWFWSLPPVLCYKPLSIVL